MSRAKTLSDRVTDALEAIEAIRAEASTKDRELAERPGGGKAQGRGASERDRKKADEATGKFDDLRAQIIKAKGDAARQIETLKARKKCSPCATGSPETRLERLRLSQSRDQEPLRGHRASAGNLPHSTDRH